ncbi:nucleotidyltransferase domain-containing protein [Avibacterium paragallinarum]|uniref:nucleotidyltransferase domain-containing protein n=1 Tax=Avibacterium paragallinarum TaxID=728 RepID=UPI0021F7DA02|nr:nucleotidyltransferase domain-containing protein [Avibacterium paragallinarum]UXN34541.1 nucleotidyltransferase domain-containing protein [Avibacterium paragallinarum]
MSGQSGKFGLSERTLCDLTRLFQAHPEIEQVIIYGSRAKGTQRAGSDIDLTLVGERLSESTLNHLFGELQESDIPYLVDLSLYHQLTHRDLIQHIQQVGQVIYQKKEQNA